MIRIKTQLGSNRIYTLPFTGGWVTIITINGEVSSIDAKSFYDAGQNHLAYCQKLVEIHLIEQESHHEASTQTLL